MKKEIESFFIRNVQGKVLFTDELSYSLEDGKLEGIYSDRMIFTGLWSSETMLGFDMTNITDEKVYETDRRERLGEPVKNLTGTGTYRYELAMRRSTGELTGYMRHVATTVPDHFMEAVVYGVYGVKFDGVELKWKERQLLYRDAPAADGKFRPVAFDASIRLYLEKGKLIFEYLPEYFDYDPLTGSRTFSADSFPPFIGREK